MTDSMNRKLRVGILGATGVVGQRFIQLLEHHPQFEVTALAASDRSQGKTYAQACTWRLPGETPEGVKQIVVQSPAPPIDCDFLFSSLPGEIAGDAEESFARAGFPVITNSSPHRMDADVPLLIPEVNPEHLELIATQRDGLCPRIVRIARPDHAIYDRDSRDLPLLGGHGSRAGDEEGADRERDGRTHRKKVAKIFRRAPRAENVAHASTSITLVITDEVAAAVSQSSK